VRRRSTPGRVRPTKLRWADRKLVWLAQVADDKCITHFTLRVALSIAQHTDAGRGSTCLSYQDLARDCRATKTGVRNAVKTLVERRHLEEPERGSRTRPAVYRMDLHPLRVAIHQHRETPVTRYGPVGITAVARSASDHETAVAPSSVRSAPKGATAVARSSRATTGLEALRAAAREAELREAKRRRAEDDLA